MPTTASARISAWLINWRWPLLAVGIVIAAIAFQPSRQLGFDRSIENMFAADDPLLAPYERLKRIFGGTEVALIVYDDEKLNTADGAERLNRVADAAREVDGVLSVVTRADLTDDLVGAALNTDQVLSAFEGYTHGADGRTVAVVCLLQPEKDTDTPRRETIVRLREIANEQPDGVLAGEPVMVVDGFDYLEADGRLLGTVCTGLLMATIVLCFRSLRWVLIPLAVVHWTLLATKATLVTAGFRLSMVSSMLTAIVTVVCVATVIHVMVRLRFARDQKLSPRDALAAAMTMLVVPVAWTCATDAVGFSSLLVAKLGPVRDFGVMMAVGSLLAMVGLALLLPGLALLGRYDLDPKRVWGDERLGAALARVSQSIEKRPKALGMSIFIVCGLLSAGAARLEVETDFTKNFRANSPIVTSYEMVEQRLGGAGVWDVMLPAPAQLTNDYLDRVAKLQADLRESAPGLTKVLSLQDVASAKKPLLPLSTIFFGMKATMPDLYATMHAEDPARPGQYFYRVMLRSHERQSSAAKQQLIEQVNKISRRHFPDAEVTGFFVLLTNLIDSTIRDQWVAFGVATAGIGVMMLIAFRSLPLAIAALTPNVLPIFVVTGLMGWLGLRINMGAAMIAAVSMGLSVDSSIHYLTQYRRQRRAGRSVHQAIADTHQDIGRAMFFSTLALICGFLALCLSEFVPTIYFGALVSLTMLGGLLGNLLVLPLLLSWFAGED